MDVTGFGSFDNSTCKRVPDLLEPGDLRLGQIVIKRVAVIKLGVNNGSGDSGGCFGIEVWTDTGKLTNIVIARFGGRWSAKSLQVVLAPNRRLQVDSNSFQPQVASDNYETCVVASMFSG